MWFSKATAKDLFEMLEIEYSKAKSTYKNDVGFNIIKFCKNC